jgi:hypothetical protein
MNTEREQTDTPRYFGDTSVHTKNAKFVYQTHE